MQGRRWWHAGLTTVTGLMALLGAWAAPAHAQMFGRWRGGGYGDAGTILPVLLRSANLRPDQQTRAREILSAHRTAVQPLIAQLHQAQHELADKLFAQGVVQDADLQSQLKKISQLREQLLQESTRAVLEVRALLTPDQLSRAAQAKDRLRQLNEEIRQLFQSPKP